MENDCTRWAHIISGMIAALAAVQSAAGLLMG
jgi:hypothetical protein